MKSKFLIFLLRVTKMMCAMPCNPNRIAAVHVQLNYAKPLFLFTLLCSWWPQVLLVQVDGAVNNISVVAAAINPTTPATYDQSTANLLRMPSTTSPNLSPQHFAVLDLRTRLNRQLKSIRDNELLVPTIHSLFNAFEPVPAPITQNDTKIFAQMTSRIEAKMTKAMGIVDETSAKITNIIAAAEATEGKTHRRTREHIQLETIVLPCAVDGRGGDGDRELGGNKSIEILNHLSHAAGHLHETSDRNFTTNTRILEEIKAIHSPSGPILRDAFFLARDNYATVSSCRRYYPNDEYRRLLVSHLHAKRLLILIDNGETVANEEHFDVTKLLVKNIIDLLGDHDRLTVVGATGEAIASDAFINARQSTASNDTFHHTTRENKQYFFEFLNSMNKTNAKTNHTRAFQYAFQLLQNANNVTSSGAKSPVLLLYVSRSYTMDAAQTKNVLEIIAFGQSRLTQPVVISTCAVVIDGNHKKEFLVEVSDQNYSKFNVELPWSGADRYWHKRLLSYRRGKAYAITRSNPIDVSLTSIAIVTDIWYEHDNVEPNIQIHQPVYDATARDHVISITKPCGDRGVFGVGLYFTELTEEFIYYFDKYADSDESYAILVDLNGTTISHPSFVRPQLEMADDVFPTDIRFLEKIDDNIWQRWRTEVNGNVTIASADRFRKVYTWQRISNHFIGCLVRVWSKKPHINHNNHFDTHDAVNNTKRADESRTDLIFHRLDLMRPDANEPKLCHYFKQLSILNKITLFLSAGAFKSPFTHMRTVCPLYTPNDALREQCTQRIESIMAYVRDTTNLLENPGLHAHVRHDVWKLMQAMELLRTRHDSLDDDNLSSYIIRRYVTSMNGVMVMYPGAVLPNDFEPTKRIWFRMALQNIGKLVVTTPYLDAAGAGYIVTVTQAIRLDASEQHQHHRERHEKQRQRKRRHHIDDFVGDGDTQKAVAIVSIDLTRGFFYHLLMQSSDYCQNGLNMKCFLIDDMGYLIAHPSILEPHTSTSGDAHRWMVDHITHKESFIANDILLHKRLVEKRVCQNLRSRKIQRFYKFNTSEVDVFDNVVNGERSKYVATSLPDTNLLVIMLNATDGDSNAAFCPCSTVDRVCFNCNRIELMNCECPCECALPSLTMQTTIKEYQYGDELLVEANEETGDRDVNLFDGVDICPSPIEEYHPSKENPVAKVDGLSSCVQYSCERYSTDCVGIMCEWCQIDIDRQSMLPSAYAAIGPVIGAVAVLCLIIVIGMYCYRNNVEPGTEQLCIESIPFENNFGLPLSRLDYESTIPDGLEKLNQMPRTGSSDISPYRMHAGNFRRPNGESDHGYSTMTPHEDSDHACFTLIEPLINSKKMSHSDSTSINGDHICTNLSSPNSFSQPVEKETKTLITNNVDRCGYDNSGATVLSSPHHIQVPVTVHHPMEASI